MKFTRSKAFKKSVHGIKLNDYTSYKKVPQANTCFISCDKGHFQEFYDKKSTFIYYIIEGHGIFYLNGKPINVKSTNLVVVKPKTKLYYLGKMKMLLTVVPAWQAKNEVHVRYIRELPATKVTGVH